MGVQLFRRLPRGLALTDEGLALVPVLSDSFRRIQSVLNKFEGGHYRDVVTIGVVGTFATGWLLPRLANFRAAHPYVDLRIMTNNNRPDLAGEGLDFAIRLRRRVLAGPGLPSFDASAAIPGLRAQYRHAATHAGGFGAGIAPPLLPRR